jgi:hypothetical protein
MRLNSSAPLELKWELSRLSASNGKQPFSGDISDVPFL